MGQGKSMVSNKARGSGVFWSNPDPVIEIRLGPFSKFDRIRIDQSDNTVLILKKITEVRKEKMKR